MIRVKVEKRVGQLNDEDWKYACEIADVTLVVRKNCKLKNTLESVLFLLIGVADAIVRGYIKKGVA